MSRAGCSGIKDAVVMTGARSKRDENGWLVPHEGTESRKVYDLAVTGMAPRHISQALPHLSKNFIEVTLWRIKNPEKLNAQQNTWRRGVTARRRAAEIAERLRRMEFSYDCSECSRPCIHDDTPDWAYWERYEDGSFICPTCRGVNPAEEQRKLFALPRE